MGSAAGGVGARKPREERVQHSATTLPAPTRHPPPAALAPATLMPLKPLFTHETPGRACRACPTSAMASSSLYSALSKFWAAWWPPPMATAFQPP